MRAHQTAGAGRTARCQRAAPLTEAARARWGAVRYPRGGRPAFGYVPQKGDIDLSFPNPHSWIPPDSALRIAAERARRLAVIDPGGAGVYQQNLKQLRAAVPPSPQHLANLIALMRREGVKLVLVEMFYSRRTADLVASKAGARLL